MSLEQVPVKPEQETNFDIIGIPAIGADPHTTWLLPTDEKGRRRYIWSGVGDARIFVFRFDGYDGELGITEWAIKLLNAVNGCRDIAGPGRHLHFAAHSTGGLVLKRALVLAMEPSFVDPKDPQLHHYGYEENMPKGNPYGWIVRNCHSVAFFGTPHYSSSALSDGACAESIRSELSLPIQYGPKLLNQLSNVENIDWTKGLSRRFTPLTLEVRRIWSFYEDLETHVTVDVKPRGSGPVTKTGFWMPIVDKRSATLTREDYYIGCEQVIPIEATHATLPRFADGKAKLQLDGYTEELSKIMNRAISEQNGSGILGRTIHVECHQFYKAKRSDESDIIKVLSADPHPTLMQFLQHGPSYFVTQRRDKAAEPLQDSENASPAQQLATSQHGHQPSQGEAQRSLPALRLDTGGVPSSGDELETITDPGMEDSPSLVSHYRIPNRDQFTFRWTHVPANNMRWVEKVLRAIEREIESSRAENDSPPDSAIGEGGWKPEFSDDNSIVKGIFNNPLSNPAGSSLSIGARELAKERSESQEETVSPASVLAAALRDPPQLVEVLEKSRSRLDVQQECAELGELGSVIEETREQVSMLKVAKQAQSLRRPPSLKTTLTTLNNAVLKRRSLPSITSTLFNPIYWNFKQAKANHGYAHGRYMMPCFEAFHPNISKTDTFPESRIRPNKIDALQMFLYFPYLHWDTFGAVKARNKLLKSDKLRDRDGTTREEIFKNGSNEKKVIWQYATNPDLSLHPRRTLDQYGYPDLAKTETRDGDQVIFRWKRDINPEIPVPEPSNPKAGKSREENDSNSDTSYRDPEPLSLTPDQREILIQDSYKVLMVDQLWCWVINEDNVVTFFPEREDPAVSHAEHKGEYTCRVRGPQKNRIIGAADLRAAIYNDVNSDVIFQLAGKTECRDCLDFMACAVWHAVTLFLEVDRPGKPVEEDLRVLQIFAESLCDIREKRTVAFSEFRETQEEVGKSLAEKKSGSAMDKLEKAIQQLSNCHDLTCLINVQDIADELEILKTLFEEQDKVLEKMETVYIQIDAKGLSKNKHGRAIKWLRDARSKVKKYETQVAKMRKTCKEVRDSYEALLDMKHKETNVVEAACARVSGEMATRQNYAMMTFTVVTVFFLPLSFFTSLFGMNVRDWSNSDHQKTLHAVMVLSGAVSAGIIVVALAAAFWTFWTVWLTNKTDKAKKSITKPQASSGSKRWTLWRRRKTDRESEDGSV